jgi:protein-tyrosine phosphatase
VQADGAGGLRRELAAGSLAQVNAGSITGLHGEGARAAVMGLIREGLASALSSDAHGPTRPPLLAAAGACLLEAGLGRDVRDALILRGPRRLLVRGIRAPLIAA